MFKIITSNSSETKKLGELLAKGVVKMGPRKRAFVIGLIGELGGGKTTFLQGFAKGLGIRNRILSPTFVILKRFKIPLTADLSPFASFTCFYHLDCYRVENSKEILDLGFADIIKKSGNIITIEWAERIRKILPKDAMIIKFRFLDKNKRILEIKKYPVVDNLPLTRFRDAIK